MRDLLKPISSFNTGTTSNTLIVTCAIVILVAILVVLELHIRHEFRGLF
jgi:hypothetical protein